ncbi:hypothetical protein CY34DRAFT_24776 [Suillus luteus UH-Slu-Lm8-n1]|uniref:Uncharacterized protein n=1 Tax=Suillus luteus UH-Slu-Lm8-n1 TaxID=930992 RepID=A0A0D0BAD1_9AGAM|nr:hypothetical protein CY34DRAFT_24776 [Suillus luteus UH-Slu-Lm8-n1]
MKIDTHVFKCMLKGCKVKIHRFLDKKDARSMGNMRKHVKACWGEEILQMADQVRNAEEVRGKGFQSLMKIGRPEYYIPSPSTVSRDVRLVFAKTRQRIAKMSIEYDGKLNFSTDGWTSPNHRVYVELLMHLEHKGIPLCILLDIVEVPKNSQT